MEQITRIGMDTSKHIFQLHGVDAADEPVLRKKLRRKEMVKFFERLAPTEVRERLVRNRTQLSNTIRGYATEFGLTASKGLCRI